MLLRKDVDFSWGEMQNKAFEIIKSKLASAPVLIHFDWTKALLVKMDASLGGAGAVLLQLLDELQWHPVAFVSWLFNRTQRNYSTTDRELLTLLLLTRKYRSYFFARDITVLTDHQPIPGYLRKDPHGRLARWISELDQFSMNIKYIPGPKNVEGDCLSRAWENLDPDVLEKTLDDLEKTKLSIASVHTHPKFDQVIKTMHLEQDSKLSAPTNYHVAALETVCGIKATAALPTDIQLAQEQAKDEDLVPLIRYLVKGELPSDKAIATNIMKQAELYALKGTDNLLVKLKKTRISGYISYRQVVPKSLQQLVVSSYHDAVWMLAHLGRDKTYERISRRYYWNNMHSFVTKYCNECLSCLAFKNPKEWAKAKLGNIKCRDPCDLVCIDLQGKWPTTPKGYKYTYTVICGFSKFLLIIPLKSKKAEYIAKKL